jgi:hypothetical protein
LKAQPKKKAAPLDPLKDAERAQQASKLMDLFDEDEVKAVATKKKKTINIDSGPVEPEMEMKKKKVVTIDSDPVGRFTTIDNVLI